MSYLGALSIGLGFSQTDSAFAEEDVEEVVVTAKEKQIFRIYLWQFRQLHLKS